MKKKPIDVWANRSRLLMVFAISMMFCLISLPPVEAKSGQLEVTYSFDDNQYFCDNDGRISLTIKNIDSSHQLKIVKAGIHFDWMQTNYYYFDNNSGNPVMLASGQSTDSFDPSFSIPVGTSITDHSWNLHIIYQEGGLWWSDETWDSATKNDFKVIDYTISIFPTSTSISQGSKATFTITVAGQNGFSKSVDLSSSGLPSGASTTFSTSSISGSGTSTMTIDASSFASMGSYSVTITGQCELTEKRTTMTSITINSGGLLGGGNTGVAGMTTGMASMIGAIIIILVIAIVVGVVLMRRKKNPSVQPGYPQTQYPAAIQQPMSPYIPPQTQQPPSQQFGYQPPPQQYMPPPPAPQVPPIPPQLPPAYPHQPPPQQYSPPPQQYQPQMPPQYPPR